MNIRTRQESFNTGDVIADRFEIVRPLRDGCQGAVYLVRHVDFPERLIAMKVLLLSQEEDFETTAARFRNEVMAAYSVTHPNVVRIYDYIRQGTLLAFTMEYILGGDLLGTTLGKSNGITGTVGYLSPEYIRDGHLDLRSDLYSLGVVAYEMIVGEVPFQGENLLDSISERLKESAPSVLEKNDNLQKKF